MCFVEGDVVWGGGWHKTRGMGGMRQYSPFVLRRKQEVFSLVAEKLKDDESSKAAPAAGHLPVLSLNSGRKMVKNIMKKIK